MTIRKELVMKMHLNHLLCAQSDCRFAFKVRLKMFGRIVLLHPSGRITCLVNLSLARQKDKDVPRRLIEMYLKGCVCRCVHDVALKVVFGMNELYIKDSARYCQYWTLSEIG